MAYDAATHTVVLFGGVGPSGDLGDTWTWNGSAWTASSALGPSPRSDSAMAYDAATRELVLYGGRTSSGIVGDTWTGDAATWTQQLSASPAPRAGAAMVYDGDHHDLVLFGGTDGVSAVGETWSWNGTYWVSATPTSQPSPRSGIAMAYDTDHHDLVLFGGTDGVNYLSDTWSMVSAATAPRNVRATSNANSTSVVTWTAPSSDGGSPITGYVVTVQDMTVADRAVPPCHAVGTATCTVTGLTDGDHYVFSVQAITLAGVGASASSNVAIPATPPGAATITGVTTSNGAATLSWNAPSSTGGIPIVSYRAQAIPGGAFCHVAATARSCRISGLRDGARYTFSVVATNAAGDGVASPPSAAVTVLATPGSPIIVVARAQRGRIELAWRWPSSNGGSRVIGYNVYVGPVSGSEATSALNARLIRARHFSFRGRTGYRTFIEVRAVNALGVGTPSREVMVYTP